MEYHHLARQELSIGDDQQIHMDLIAHWLKDEQSLEKELQQAMLAMGQQLNETPEAGDWPLKQWQSWLEQNSFDLALLQQALLKLFANAGEAEPYAAICQELSQQPDDGPGIEALLACAEHHSEQLVPQLLTQLEAEAKETEALLQTSGGSSSSHHKLAQNMSNHRIAWSVGGAVGALAGTYLFNKGVQSLKLRGVANQLTNLFGNDNQPPTTSAWKAIWRGGDPDKLGEFRRVINDGRMQWYSKDVQFTETYRKHWYGNTWDREYADWKSFFKAQLHDLNPLQSVLGPRRTREFKRELEAKQDSHSPFSSASNDSTKLQLVEEQESHNSSHITFKSAGNDSIRSSLNDAVELQDVKKRVTPEIWNNFKNQPIRIAESSDTSKHEDPDKLYQNILSRQREDVQQLKMQYNELLKQAPQDYDHRLLNPLHESYRQQLDNAENDLNSAKDQLNRLEHQVKASVSEELS